MLRSLFSTVAGRYRYTGRVIQEKLKRQQIEPSMSRVGHCIDNDPIEGLWRIIKSEMYQMYEITDEASLEHAVFSFRILPTLLLLHFKFTSAVCFQAGFPFVSGMD